MTINGISGAATSFPPMDPADTITGTGGALAALVLDAQAAHREADHERLEDARAAYQEALTDEVNAMHAAADQVFWGAIAQGAFGIAAGAVSVCGTIGSQASVSKAFVAHDDKALSAALKPTIGESIGGAMGQLGAPLGQFVSGSGGEHSRADAKAAAGDGEQARWVIDDMKKRIDQSEQTTDRTVQWQSTLVDKDAATMSSLISNFA